MMHTLPLRGMYGLFTWRSCTEDSFALRGLDLLSKRHALAQGLSILAMWHARRRRAYCSQIVTPGF